MRSRRRVRKPVGLERIVESGLASEFEVQIYEHERDPQTAALDRAIRGDEGQTRRHRHRLEARAKKDTYE